MYQNDDEKLKKFFNKTTEDENKKKHQAHTPIMRTLINLMPLIL